jgi:hypothetical protein
VIYLVSKKLVITKEPKIIIKEEIRLGFFKNKLKKEYIWLINEFKEATEKQMKIDDLIEHLQSIKSFIESKLKGKYTDIFIEVGTRSDWDDGEYTHFDVVLGRLETDKEYKTRIEERKQSRKIWAAQELKNDAKRYLELKNKFEPKGIKK